MKRKQIRVVTLTVAIFAHLCLATSSRGREEDEPSTRTTESLESLPKKTPSLFNRPARSTPSAQAQYADSLLARGRLKASARQYSALVRTWHDSPQAPYAQWQLSILLDRLGRHKDAFREIQYLIQWFPGQFPFDQAIERQFQIANQVRTARRATFMFGGFEAPEEAFPLLQQVARNAPRGRHAPEAWFQMALIKENAREFEEAARIFEHIRITYSSDPYAEQAAFHRARCIAAMARLHPRNEPTYREAIAAFAQFIRDFPMSQFAQQADQAMTDLKEQLAVMAYERASFYDRKGYNPKAAIIALSDFVRNFPTSELAIRALRRIEELRKITEVSSQ